MAEIRETPPEWVTIKTLLDYNPKTGILTWTASAPANMRNRRAGSQTMAGYRVVNVKGIAYYEHHLAWYIATGAWPRETLDHINRDKADNRLSNLREATRAENNHNSKIGQVYKRSNKWAAQLTHHGKLVYLGVYTCFGEAIKARNAKKRELQPFAEAYRK